MREVTVRSLTAEVQRLERALTVANERLDTYNEMRIRALAAESEVERLREVEKAARVVARVLGEEHIEENGACFACEVEWPCYAADLFAALAPNPQKESP